MLVKAAQTVCVLAVAGAILASCGSSATTSARQADTSASATTGAATIATSPASTPTATASLPTATRSQSKTKARPKRAPVVTPSSTVLTPNQILAQGRNAVDHKTVSPPVLRAAVMLGTAQAQQLGKPAAQYVATTAFIGYLDQLQFFCTDSPDRLANVVINVGNKLYKQDSTATYGQVMRVMYQSSVGKPKHACAFELAAAAAATG
jgi:hypothetical protein